MRRQPLWTPTRSGVAACIVDGLTNRETCRAMGCTTTTVQRHVKVMMRAFGARNRVNLAAMLGACAEDRA